jgi:hypothetical protein
MGDTAQGYIEIAKDIYGDEFQDLVDLFEFPLCFDPADQCNDIQSLLNSWFRVYKVCGGYYPCTSGTQEFNLYQYDKDFDNQDGTFGAYVIVTSPGYQVGWSLDWHMLDDVDFALGTYNGIDLTELDTSDDCCCISYWVVTIDTSCDNKGCLNSNEFPTVPSDCETVPETLSGYLGKDIIAELEMTWCGCPDPSQCFELILAQITRIPNSRIDFKNFIAS